MHDFKYAKNKLKTSILINNPLLSEMGDMDDFFLDSFEWRDRLKRTLLYPGNQSIDFTMPIQVSGKNTHSSHRG